MAPNTTSDLAATGVLYEDDQLEDSPAVARKADKVEAKEPFKAEWIWLHVIFIAALHVGSLYGLYLIFSSAKIQTTLLAFILYPVCILGITAGVHRLWSHRAYKAKWQLRVILTFFNTIAFQRSVLTWSKVHRLHHKYSDTDGDPHNSRRGLFFSHMGWVMMTKHPDIIEKGKGIDMSDLEADPILRFQDKYYWYLMPLCCFILPTVVPVYFWNESWVNGFFIPGVLRYLFTIHITALVNSFGHFYGNKPYDRNLQPTQNKSVSLVTLGEGWHNYHHTFPWDYKTSELGDYGVNFTNAFIDFFAWVGWAYDLKSVSMDMIKKRVQRTGDGSHELWGWGDKDITKEDKEVTIITRKSE
ncbi:acyl-CoA Delta-9 desaturase-like [Phymastichus coffea]|uniref:acyl-CoA Delta-9 desaturase-like n=1 Tax=Phymastichus coffea TaxID=108790 RepID=UPI00273BC0F6|nr:acyl-CoA Delta-9 desaturase-like [Phymastichus coffea]